MQFYLLNQFYTNQNKKTEMAERYPEIEVPLVIDPTEARINQTFDHLVLCLNKRRVELIADFRQRQEERRAQATGRIHTLKQLTNSKAHLQAEMKENVLHSLREGMMEEMDAKMKQLKVVMKETEILFECNTQLIEETISELGQLVEREIISELGQLVERETISELGQLVERETISTPNYPALLQPRISVGKKGTAEGELRWARGLAFDEKTKLIYIVDRTSSSISVFSLTGVYIDTFCKGQLGTPAGIALSGEDAYVSDTGFNSIFHFKLTNFQLISKVGKKGTGKGEFDYPHNLTVAPNRDVFVADSNNNRVVVMTPKLKHKQHITHYTMTRPSDVKILDDNVYVLSYIDNPCLHVFNRTGDKLRSFISRSLLGNEQIRECYSFCFDKKQNIIMGDLKAGNIKVFSKEGALLHTLGDTHKEDKTINPFGIVVTNNKEIICSSSDTKLALHIFY